MPVVIQLSLTVEEVNLILGALGTLPYGQVKDFIPRIVAASQAQLAAASMVQEAPSNES